METLHLVIIALFALLLLSLCVWLLLYLGPNSASRPSSPWYRWHQLLIGLIATLTILLAILVVLSSDPGELDEYLYWL